MGRTKKSTDSLSKAFERRSESAPVFEINPLREGIHSAVDVLPASRGVLETRPDRVPALDFGRQYFSHYCMLPPSRLHVELCDEFERILAAPDGERIAIAAPRGSAKTTWASLLLPLMCIAYDLKRFVVLISDTQAQAIQYLSDIKHELTENLELAEAFPYVVGKGPIWRADEIVTASGCKVMALGAGQRIRGRRYRQWRPDLVILDDLENDELVRSAEQRDKLHKWLLGAVLKAKGPRQKLDVLVLGTVMHFDSVLSRLLNREESKGWRTRFYQAVIEWATHEEMWATWETLYTDFSESDEERERAALEYYETHELQMLEGTEVLWPEGQSYYELMKIRIDEGPRSFDAELQNEPVDPTDQFFEEKRFRWFDLEEVEGTWWLRPDEGDAIRLQDCDIYGACDPSMGKQNKHSDPSALAVLACYPALSRSNGDGQYRSYWLIECDVRRRRPSEILDEIEEMHQTWGFMRFGCEAVQFQELFADDVADRCPSLNVKKLIPTKDKGLRIERLQPFIHSGRLKWNRRITVAYKQTLYYGQRGHDDGPDCIEMAMEVAGAITWVSFTAEVGADRMRQKPRPGSPVDQIQQVIPEAFTEPSMEYVCATCSYFQAPENGRVDGVCGFHKNCMTEPKAVACEQWDSL